MSIRKSKKALTLVELIIAMAILGIILISFLSGLSSGFVGIISMGNKTRAVTEAQAIIDFIYKENKIEESTLLSTFDIADEVAISDLLSSTYNPSKPIYYSVESKSIGSSPVIEVNKVTVLVYYQNGDRHITLSALIP